MLSNNNSNHSSPAYSPSEESRTFPLIPDEIHKVPENIRKALKVGKHRKNIQNNIKSIPNPTQANSYSHTIAKAPSQEMGELGDSSRSHPAKDKDKEKPGLHVRQIFHFLKGKFNAEDEDEDEDSYPRDRFFKSEVYKNKISGDRILYARKKLVPLKKGLTVEPRKLMTRDKRNLKVTFLNVEKVELVKMYNESPNKSKVVESPAKTAFNMVSSSITNTNTTNTNLNENFLELSGSAISNQNQSNSSFRHSFYDRSPSKAKNKPFTPPFQRYNYRDFIWKCAFSNYVFHEAPESYEQKFKVFIGRGNNSMLLKSLMKKRKSWWIFTDRYDEAHFAWTQIKLNAIFAMQKSQNTKVHECQPFCPSPRESKPSAERSQNLKILTEHEYIHWEEYFSKFRKAEDSLDETMKKRNRVFSNQNNKFTCKELTQLDPRLLRIHNHLPNNYILGNKKALFYTMSKFYEQTNQEVFEYLPLTFHIQNGLEDQEYLKFLKHYYERAKRIRSRDKVNNSTCQQVAQHPSSPQSPSRISAHNMWIVKPGEFTNRGNGITVCMNLQEIKAILKKNQRHDNGNYKTYIIQSYIEKPFLYQRRKFDLRHYMMMTSINGVIKGYWYQHGYIRTTSFQYTVKNGLSSVHLTNDAVQKFLPQYGKYEKGNKISYDDFQKYLQKDNGVKYDFYGQIYPRMKKIATDSMKACSLMIDPEKKGHNFEVFGMDFMIDADFHPWLIEINNNPCLELSCPLLGEIIPPMVENTLKICIDSLIPPPGGLTEKRSKLAENPWQTNQFELVYDSSTEQSAMTKIFNGDCQLGLDFKQLEKDEDQVFDDDGVELED